MDAWASSSALTAIVAASGVPASGSHGAILLDELAGASARWDARAGRERDQAVVRQYDPRFERLVLNSAAALGQTGRTTPRRSDYDAVVMTGGMVRAEIVKPRFVRELLDSGLTTREVLFLGGFRAFSAEERSLACALSMTSTDEFPAMAEGLSRAFGPLGDPESEGDGEGSGAWRELSWRVGALRLSVLAAPSSDPDTRRANTADTFAFWAGRRSAGIRRVLVVTTPVYVPYQAAVAVELLGVGHDLAVETVGVSASASDLGEFAQPFLTQHHLQELRSAILAMRSLRAAVVGAASRA